MKQVVQDFKDGKIKVIEVSEPTAETGYLIVKNHFSLISAGTEKTTVGTGKKNIIGKARSRPDLVKKVLDTIKKEGLSSTIKKVKSKLEDYKLLGYSSAGEVLEIGEGVRNFNVGDRVACAGGGYALHAEIIRVPVNLCAKIPKNMDFDEAAFSTIGAIALQGIRQADVRVGEKIGVIGLGLIGILTVQILKASGTKVFGIDVNPKAVNLAKKFGLDTGTTIENEDIRMKVKEFTGGFGLDSVIITAGTNSSLPVNLASEILRDKGRVIVVGNVGMELERENFYMKELELDLSRSYGPGRYDPLYEEKGIDYPIGYVRWTEKRNMETILDLISEKKINIKELITHKFSIDSAIDAYDLILKGKEKFLGVVFEYKSDIERKKRIYIPKKEYKKEGKVRIGVIGAGNFGKTFILPPLTKNSNVVPVGIATLDGADALNVSKKFGFSYSTADYKEILKDSEINTIFILTRHNLHAKIVIEALNNGKNVYVEKPLAMKKKELSEIKEALNNSKTRLMVGFNRRFSPHSIKLKEFIGNEHSPLIANYRINAGELPVDHWLKDPDFGGGRIIGEGCHFIDYIRFLAGHEIKNLTAISSTEKDNKVLQIEFTDCSIGTISYITIGDKTFSKERIEVFVDGKVGIIEDFRITSMSVCGKRKYFKTRAQDKGYEKEIELFIESITKGIGAPITPEELLEVTKWTIEADRF